MTNKRVYKIDGGWSSASAGDEVQDGYFYGDNAFSAFPDAYDALVDATRTLDVLGGDAVFDVGDSAAGGVDVTVESGAVLNITGGTDVFGNAKGDDSVMTIHGGAGAVSSGDDAYDLTFKYNTRLLVGGGADAATLSLGGTALGSGSGSLSIVDKASMLCDNAEVNVSKLSLAGNGAVRLEDSTAAADNLDLGYCGTLALASSTLTVDKNDESALDGILTLDAASELTLNVDGETVVNTGDIRVKAQSVLIFDAQAADNGSFVNAGAMLVSDSRALVTGAFENGGEIAVAGSSGIGEMRVEGAVENTGELTLARGLFAAETGDGMMANASDGTVALSDGSQLLVTGVLTNEGVISVDNCPYDDGGDLDTDLCGGLLVKGVLDNQGEITLDAESALVVGDFGDSGVSDAVLRNAGHLQLALNQNHATVQVTAFEDAGGSIAVDMGAASCGSYCIIDALDTVDWTGVTVDFGDAKFATGVIDGDLYALQTSAIVVDYTQSSPGDDEHVEGVNWFTNFADAAAATSDGSRSYEFTYGQDAYMTLSVQMSSGVSRVTLAEKDGGVLGKFLTSGHTVRNYTLDAGTTYVLSFDGDSADFDFDTDFQVGTPNADVDVGEAGSGKWVAGTGNLWTYEDTADSQRFVGFNTGEQVYTFSVGDESSGRFTFNLDCLGDRMSYSIATASGKRLTYGSVAGKSVARTLELTSGDYVVTLDSYDKGKGKYNSAYEFSISAQINSHVSGLDDTVSNTGTYNEMKNGEQVDDFVGLGDKTDYIKLDLEGVSGTYTFTLDAEEGYKASGLKFALVRQDGRRLTTVRSCSYSGSTAAIREIMLDGSGEYYLKLATATASSSSRNATYTVDMTRESVNNGLSDADDERASAVAVSADDITEFHPYEEWVGTEDTVDWIKLADVQEGDNTLCLDVAGQRVAVTVYSAAKSSATSALRTVATLNGYDGETTEKTIRCSASYDYYVRFKAVAGSSVSSNYAFAIRS